MLRLIRIKNKYSFLLMSIICLALTYSQAQLILNNNWQFRKKGDTSGWMNATVPGTVHTDLMKQNQIPDPYYRDNETKVQWVDREDWEYQTNFSIPKETLDKNHIELIFEGLDTYADVYLNDTKILEADNMFRTWKVDVKQWLKPNNKLYILFHSAQNRVEELAKMDAAVEQSHALADQARKFQALNANVITGPLTGSVPEIGQSADMQSLDKISKSLLTAVPRLPGSQSNFDSVNIGKSTLSPKAPKEVNDAIARRYIALDTLNTEKQEFLNNWRTVHSGSTQGADTVWTKYLKENPILDPKHPKEALPNPDRMPIEEWVDKTYYSPPKPAVRSAAPKAAPVPNEPVVRGGKVQYWGRDKNGNPVLLERPKS